MLWNLLLIGMLLAGFLIHFILLQAFWPSLVMKKWLNIKSKANDFSEDEVDTETESEDDGMQWILLYSFFLFGLIVLFPFSIFPFLVLSIIIQLALLKIQECTCMKIIHLEHKGFNPDSQVKHQVTIHYFSAIHFILEDKWKKRNYVSINSSSKIVLTLLCSYRPSSIVYWLKIYISGLLWNQES